MASRARLAFVLMLVVGPLASCMPDDRGRPLGAEPERRVEGVAPMPDLDKTATIRAEVGQTIYVPAYSRVPTSDSARTFNLAVTLSVRNADRSRPIVVSSVRYLDADGHLVREFLARPLQLAPLASKNFFVKESDTSGGTSASFLVEWFAERPATAPVVETVMIGTASSQGISFVSPGRVIAERDR